MYGYILIDLGQYQKSEELFKDLTLDFDFTEINYALANIYERTNRKQDAIEHYEKTITNNPEFEQAHFSLAYIYDEISEDEAKDFENENVQKAIKHYKESIRLNDKNFWSFINIGSIYERFNYNEEALQYFLKAYEVDNTKEMVCYNLGVAYYKLKQYDKSLKYYLEELEKENPFKSTYYNLGILYKDGFKDYEKAKIYYLKGLELNNEDYNIWYNLGCIHALLKDFPLTDKPVWIKAGLRRRADFCFGGGVFGFFESRSKNIVPLDSCPNLLPQINAVLPSSSTILHFITQNVINMGRKLGMPYWVE